MNRGLLVLVVGPSGAGKDSLIDAARNAWPAERLAVARRAITRPADAGGEDHEAVDGSEFAQRRDTGGFALHWQAHGLSYGIPAAIDATLASGTPVLANVSRTMVGQARRRFAPVIVIEVTAPAEILAERLGRRGRDGDVGQRLERAALSDPALAPDIVLVNDGSLEDARARFLEVLENLLGTSRKVNPGGKASFAAIQ